MSLLNIKQGRKTIAAISFFTVLLFVVLALESFGVIKAPYNFFSAWGAGIATLFGAIILTLETWFEGAKPDLKKDIGALINTMFSIVMGVFGTIILMANITIAGALLGVLGVTYSLTAILLMKELLFD